MSNTMTLRDAVNEIVRSRRALEGGEPFFLIVGAGVSAPSIKTAGMLISDFKAKYESDKTIYDLPDILPPSEGLDLYSFWFEKAYPQPILRRNFLKHEMRNKAPSPAVLRLAHLLISKQLCSMVITPNFDDLLHQALLLFGSYPILCDHPSTSSRIEIENTSDVQLVHVHGTFNFYDLCNLRGEITARSLSTEGQSSIASLLSQILSHRSPIVIGYSGWDHDVIMTALRERLKTRPASLIYWFCYSVAAYDNLPPWLKESDYVRFVLPATTIDLGRDSHENINGDSHQDLDLTSPDPQDKIRAPSVLTAVEVLDLLNERFDVDEPLITRDPFEYLAERLEPINLITSGFRSRELLASEVTDSYDFLSVVKRLRHAAQRETEERQETESTLEQIRASLRRSRYKRAYSLSASSSSTFISVAESGDLQPLKEFVHLFSRALSNVESDAPVDIVESLLNAGSSLARLSQDASAKVAPADAAIMHAARLSRSRKRAESLALTEKVLALIGDDRAPSTLISIKCNALIGKAVNLLELDEKSVEGFGILDDLISMHEDGIGPEWIASAYLQKARYKEGYDESAALKIYDDLLERFRNDVAVRAQVAEGVLGAARLCNSMKLYERTLHYADLSDHLLREHVDARQSVRLREVSVAKGVALNRLERFDEAIASFAVVIAFDESERKLGSALRQMNSLQMSARLYAKKGDLMRARELYTLAIERYSQDPSAHMQLHVSECRTELANLADGKQPEELD